jgi:hypothetical protein
MNGSPWKGGLYIGIIAAERAVRMIGPPALRLCLKNGIRNLRELSTNKTGTRSGFAARTNQETLRQAVGLAIIGWSIPSKTAGIGTFMGRSADARPATRGGPSEQFLRQGTGESFTGLC